MTFWWLGNRDCARILELEENAKRSIFVLLARLFRASIVAQKPPQCSAYHEGHVAIGLAVRSTPDAHVQLRRSPRTFRSGRVLAPLKDTALLIIPTKELRWLFNFPASYPYLIDLRMLQRQHTEESLVGLCNFSQIPIAPVPCFGPWPNHDAIRR